MCSLNLYNKVEIVKILFYFFCYSFFSLVPAEILIKQINKWK